MKKKQTANKTDLLPIIVQAHEEISATPRGKRGPLREKWAAAAGISEKSLDRLFLDRFGRHRAPRRDSASVRIKGFDAFVRRVYWLKNSFQKRFSVIMSTEAAIRILSEFGLAPKETISVSTVSNRLRELKQAKQAKKKTK